jgi:outer membrane protein assembly factor BamB
LLVAACALPAASGAAVPAWTTYDHDAARSGVDPDSTSPMTPKQVWQSPTLDGSVYGQPLVYGSRVYVATENDTVYALDAATGAVVWHQNVGTPVPQSQIPCSGNISPAVGITGTPVIDPATNRIYAVADIWDGSDPSTIEHELVGFDLTTGAPAPGLPEVVDPSGTTPAAQLQRPGLALDDGKVVIGFGGNSGDCGSYHGMVVAVPEGGGPLQAFIVDDGPGEVQGAVWGAGNGLPVDASGDVWAATGNGDGGGNPNGNQYGDAVLRLDPNMNLLDWFTPTDFQSLDNQDLDLGSSDPLLLPGGLVFQAGKDSQGYLLSSASLGHLGGQLFVANVGSGGVYGGGIYVAGTMYIAAAGGLSALTLDTTAPSFTAAAGWKPTSNVHGPPIYAGRLVWSAGGGVLYGLDPATGATKASFSVGAFATDFPSPSAAGGRLFIAGNNHVTAITIANPPPASATTTALGSSANPAAAGDKVTYTATVSPAPDAGTVAFSDGGAAIAGCSSVPVSAATPQAQCTDTFGQGGSHAIVATYSGDPYYSASGSAPLTQVVSAGGAGAGTGSGSAPLLSRARLSRAGRRLTLAFTLDQNASVSVILAEVVRGRFNGRRCIVGRHHGARCLLAVRKARHVFAGRIGRDRVHLTLPALAAARYVVRLTALGAGGVASHTTTLVFTV